MSDPGPIEVSGVAISDVRRKLLDHYDTNARDLPWRESNDAYRIWISEVMLQQTRVAAVEDRYRRWLERFPSLESLAEASVDDVLHEWQGLGYYARARNLHAAARVVRDRHAGEIPSDPKALRELPGVGEYTAGAIASIAYDRRTPAVDANARRVLSRLVDRDLGAAELRQLAGLLVPDGRPGDFNQALMELGATVCTARSPRCDVCPLRVHCAARKAGTQDVRAGVTAKPDVPAFDLATLILLDHEDRLLLRRRPDTGLLARLWELPAVPVSSQPVPDGADGHGASEMDRSGSMTDGSPAAVEIASAARALLASLSGAADHTRLTYVTSLRHAFTHRVETYHAFRARVGDLIERPLPPRHEWVRSGELHDFALPAAQSRLANLAWT